MGPAIVGTIVITAAAAADRRSARLLGAIYLHEYGKQRGRARVVRFLATVMTGVPSIVMGLFVYMIFTLRFGLSGPRRLAGAGLPDAPDRHPHDRGDAAARARRPARGAASRSAPARPAPSHGRAARRGARHRERLPARRRPRRRRDRAAAVHHRRRETAQLERVHRAQHGALVADLRQRHTALRRPAGAGLGCRADAGRHRVPVHHHRPGRHRPATRRGDG